MVVVVGWGVKVGGFVVIGGGTGEAAGGLVVGIGMECSWKDIDIVIYGVR